jgi:crotonobetainyl-CoA:carnitine CoA-transferase CaiB-like acyl-CoA transferase
VYLSVSGYGSTGLGDISAALFATVGVLAALRHRDIHDVGQHVDIAMVDSVVSMTDTVTDFWSMGIPQEPDPAPFVIEPFLANDGWFVLQIGRRHEFERTYHRRRQQTRLGRLTPIEYETTMTPTAALAA